MIVPPAAVTLNGDIDCNLIGTTFGAFRDQAASPHVIIFVMTRGMDCNPYGEPFNDICNLQSVARGEAELTRFPSSGEHELSSETHHSTDPHPQPPRRTHAISRRRAAWQTRSRTFSPSTWPPRRRATRHSTSSRAMAPATMAESRCDNRSGLKSAPSAVGLDMGPP